MTSPFGCSITQTVNSNYRQVFSFSLFITKNIMAEFVSDLKNNRSPSLNVINWYIKYPLTQLQSFIRLFDNPNWQDYGIIHFLSSDLADLPIISRDSYQNVYYYNYGTSFSTMFRTEIEKINRYKYSQYLYDCPNFYDKIETEVVSVSEQKIKVRKVTSFYFGSLVRFLPLVLEGIDVVLFRDAHSTMPNSSNNYDRQWHDTWLNNTDKRFWMYTSPWYNPPHADGEHVPFVATWGARTINKTEKSIFSDLVWANTFGYLDRIDNANWYKQEKYGIDERMFHYLFQYYKQYNKTFQMDCYFVGMTWIGYLFINPSNTNEYIRYENPNDPQKDKKPIVKDGNHVYLVPTSHGWGTQSIYSEIKCVLLFLLKQLAKEEHKPIEQITIDTFWKYVEQLQSLKLKDSVSNTFFNNSIELCPSRYHLWEYLFETNFETSDPLIPYVERFSRQLGYSKTFDISHSCDIVQKYFIGDVFDPSIFRYKHDEDTNMDIPDNIIVPVNHPIYKREENKRKQKGNKKYGYKVFHI